MPDIIIRPATKEDWPIVLQNLTYMAQLHNGLRPDLYTLRPKLTAGQFGKLVKNPQKTPVLVAVDEDGNILGHLFAELHRERKSGVHQGRRYLYINDLCVDEAFRGQGVGSRLLEEAALLARLHKLTHMELNVVEANENTLHFYEARGYRTQKRTMELELSGN